MSHEERPKIVPMTLPEDVLEKLREPAAALGIDLPGISRIAPSIDLTMPMRHVALELGRIAAQQSMFLKGDFVTTVDPETGEEKRMTARRFVGWCEEFVMFRAPGARRMRDSLSVEDAAQILEQDIFLETLRPLDAVYTMRLPVQREDGTVEFLEPGYDARARVLTVDLVKYPMDWTLEQAREFLCDVCCEIPWHFPENAPAGDLLANRSFAVHVLAMVGTYCRAMFPPGTLRPIIAYFANKPGTGKTRLAEMALSHVYGEVGGADAPKDAEKMAVQLEAIAQSFQPFIILDDIGHSLRSNALNRFVTETVHNGRKFHSNSEFFKVPNVTQLFVTANDLNTSEDIGRRALVAELFLDTEVRGRKFKRTITSQWLSSSGTRAQFLAACCAIVKHWTAPTNHDEPCPSHVSPLETFEAWTGKLGAMVMLAGFADPLKAPEGVVGGANDENEVKELLILAATIADQDETLTRAALVELARDHGLCEDLVGSKGDKDLDEKSNKRFGRRMQRWRGQKLTDSKGRKFQFGHKRKKAGATYPLTFIKEAPPLAD